MPYDPLPEDSENSDRWSTMIKALPIEERHTVWLLWSILAGVAVISCLSVIIRILSSRKHRNSDFGRLVIGLAIPDAIFGGSCCVTCLLHAVHGEWFGGSVHCDVQSAYTVFGFAGSTWMYVVVARRLHHMASCLKQGLTYSRLTCRQIIQSIVPAYGIASILSTMQFIRLPMKANAAHGLACVPMEYDMPSAIFHWAVFINGAGVLPLILITYFFGKTFLLMRSVRTQAKPRRTGRAPSDEYLVTSDLQWAFTQLFALMLVFWVPAFVFIWVAAASPRLVIVGASFSHLQGTFTSLMSLAFLEKMKPLTCLRVLGLHGQDAQRDRHVELSQSLGGKLNSGTGIFGMTMGELDNLAVSYRAWLDQELWDSYTQRSTRKNMYQLASEIVIPATTLEEHVVTIEEADLQKLRPVHDGGVLFSQTDLTLAYSSHEPCDILLGGQTLPIGLTVHGRLSKNGQVRREYWAERTGRDAKWVAHKYTRHVQEGLPELAEMGEDENKVECPSHVKAKDTIVLRRGVSYVDMLRLAGRAQLINFFVSHWWGGEFLSFIAALNRHSADCADFLNVDPANISYWICTFCISQHRVELGDTLLDSPFYRALKQIAAHDGAVLLMAEPWDRPELLKRAWCAFEILTSTEDLNISIEMVFPPSELQTFLRDIKHTTSVMDNAISTIDISSARASVPSDEEKIFQAIRSFGGPDKVNKMIQSTMRRAMVATTVRFSMSGSVSPLKRRDVGSFRRSTISSQSTINSFRTV